MLHSRIAGVVLFGSMVVLAAPAYAGEPATASMTPGHGPVGVAVTIQGTGCVVDGEPGSLNFGFVNTRSDGPETTLSPYGGNEANPDGSWAFGVVIPAMLRTPDGGLVEVTPSPDYAVRAVCIFDGRPELWVWYPEMPFQVTDAPFTPDPDPVTTPEPGDKPPAENVTGPDRSGGEQASGRGGSTVLDATPIVATPLRRTPPYTG